MSRHSRHRWGGREKGGEEGILFCRISTHGAPHGAAAGASRRPVWGGTVRGVSRFEWLIARCVFCVAGTSAIGTAMVEALRFDKSCGILEVFVGGED